MKVGDVYWVELPARGGHAQAGRRPAIILQRTEVSARLPTVLICPLTTQLDALRFPGTVLLESDTDNGLRRNSVALVFQLTVVDRRVITDKLGHISHTILQEIWASFDEIIGRDGANSSLPVTEPEE